MEEGVIEEALPSLVFRVKLGEDRVILCYLGGKMRRHRIRVVPGDRVRVEVSRYDETKGRIVYRLEK